MKMLHFGASRHEPMEKLTTATTAARAHLLELPVGGRHAHDTAPLPDSDL
jgi:hypothetical protein